MPEAEFHQTRERRVPWPDRWLLDALRELGHPAVEKLKAANSAWEAAVAAGASPGEVLDIVCQTSGAPPADLSKSGPKEKPLLSIKFAARYGVVPVRMNGSVLDVASANPLTQHLERDLAFAAGRQIRITVASPPDVRDAYERIYGVTTTGGVPTPRLEWVIKEGPLGTRAEPTRGMVMDSLDRLIADALDQRASDIHFEPKEDDLLVRFRVDGILHDVSRIPVDVAPLVMSRLKVLAGLDIADRRRPQDGRATTRFDGRVVDLRVSTLPLNDRHEKAVIRLLDAASATHGLAALGFTAAENHRVNKLLGQHEGMVLVTGPTGSGKTTTLYAAVENARSPETNIVTVEDPIEYNLEGINQVQVNEKAGLGFASALRSIVRQDPDVILIGEIRDGETAGIAVKAGLTGHLVLSTLHTIDAPSAIGRLADIGVDLGALSGALKGVIAQRLIRRLCEACCKTATVADLPTDQQRLLAGRKTEKLRVAVGCEACRSTGYRGRMVVPEVLLVSDDMRSAIARGADRIELQEHAKRAGMVPLWESGIRRVLNGSTSIAELLDNVPAPLAHEQYEQGDVESALARLRADASAAVGTPAMYHSPAVQAASFVALSAPTAPPVPRPSRMIPSDAPRVLLVHDARDERRALRDALEEMGCAVIEAADGLAALSYARRLKPTLLVTELVLPQLDGFALIQVVSSELQLPVVAYTVQLDREAQAWARELGCRDVVTADRGPTALASSVVAVLGGKPSGIRLAV